MINIGLIVNKNKDINFFYTEKIINMLNDKGFSVFSNEKILDFNIKITESVFSECQVIITLGGDGTILHIASQASENNVPIIGINLGTKGYLTQLELSEIDMLPHILKGDFEIENRMMLDVYLERNGQKIFNCSVLNDAVIKNGDIAKISDYKLYSDNMLVSEYRADGLIISSPTGSTAYSMSAGGPIIEPSLSAITVTPVSAHSLTARPIVFSDKSVLLVEIPVQKNNKIYLSTDGNTDTLLYEGDKVYIIKSDKTVSLIKIKEKSFYEVLCKKFSNS